jgi:hypothetical protein
MPDEDELLYPSITKPLSLPSYFSEAEATILGQKQSLLAQQQQTAQTYAATWAEKPWYERAARSVGAWLPLERLGTPSLRLGLTPSETQAFTLRTAKDVDELTRKQRVTTQAQQIINTINLFHTAGMQFKSEGELEALFAPISGKDWTQEDRDWVLNYARTALTFTEGEEELPPGLNPEDLLTPTKEAKIYLPEAEQRLIASTVAFSKDISEVVGALKEMYTPITPTKDEAVQQLEDYIREADELVGLSYNEDKSVQDNAILYQDYLNAHNSSLASQWVWLKENDPVAYEQQISQYKFTPYSKDDRGYPVLTDEEKQITTASSYIQERLIQDSWDDFLVAAKGGIVLSAERTFGATLPSYLLYPDIPESAYGEVSTWEKVKGVFALVSPIGMLLPHVDLSILLASDEQKLMLDKANEEKRIELAAKEAEWTQNYEEWYTSHPELAPKPEYEQGFTSILENQPSLLLDPGYLSYLFLRQGLPTITGVAISTGVTIATKNPVLGGVVGCAWFIPQNMDSLKQDLLNNGATYDQANKLSVPIGLVISAVEGLGDIPYLKALSPAFSKILNKNMAKEVVGLTARQLLKKGIRTAGAIELTETLEEVVQMAIQNATVKTIDESRGVFEGLSNTTLQSLVMVLPFSLFGGGISVKYVNNNLSSVYQEKVKATVDSLMKEEGISEEQAYLTAITQLGETQEGLEVVTEAVEKTKMQESGIKAQQQEEKMTEAKKFVDTHNYFADTVKTKNWAIISGWVNAEEAKRLTAKQQKELNVKRSAELVEYMTKQTTHSYHSAVWMGNNVKGEESIFIEGIDDATAREIGTMFKQDTVLTPKGYIYADNTYSPADLTKLSIDGLETAHTVIDFNGEKHSLYIPVNDKVRLQLELETNVEKLSKTLEKKYGLDSVLIDEGVPVLESAYHTGGVEKWITVGTKDIMDFVGNDADAKTFTTMLMLHEIGHNLDPLVTAKGGDVLAREVNAWKSVVSEATKYGLKQSDVIRILRDFAPSTKYEGLLGALTKAGVVPTEAPILPIAAQGEELIPLSGIPSTVPEGYSKITGLKQIKRAVPTEAAPVVVGVAPGVTLSDASGGQPPLTLEGMTNPPPPKPKGWWQRKTKGLGELIRDVQTLKYTFMNYDTTTKRIGAGETYYNLSYNTELAYSASEATSRKSLNLILNNPRLARFITDESALARIEQELRARNPEIVKETGIKHPALSDAEMEFANTIEKINKARELGIRYRRFTTAWDRHDGSVDAILKDIPDGNIEDFTTAGAFITANNDNSLLDFLATRTWGVMQSGYTPTQVYYPDVLRRHKWTETIGYGALQTRENIELPEMEANLWQREVKYVTQQDLGFRMTSLMQQANKMLKVDEAKGQLSDKQIREIGNTMRDYFDTLTQRRASRGAATQFAMNMAGQSYTTIFETYPILSVRNIIQGLMFYWDRIGLVKSLKTPMTEIEHIFFDNKSSEMEGIRRDALLKGETSGLKIFTPLNRLAGKIGMFSHSETFSRKSTFHAAYTKALAANNEYLKSAKGKKDFSAWLRKSDAWVLETPQRVAAMNYLLENKTSLAVPGLTNLTGAEASALYVADQAVDIVHYRYTRAYRGKYEHSDTGKILFGLSTYPRSYAEMMVRRVSKVMDKSLPWNLRIKGLYEVLAIVIAGTVGAAALTKLTGRKTKSYSPWDMFNWSFGGLTVGVLQDLTGTTYDLLQAVIGNKESQNTVLSRLGKDVTGLAREFIPWYQAAMHLYETAIDKEYVDTAFVRKFFSTIKENYTPQEIETMERSWWEKLQHAIFGGTQVEPDIVEKQGQTLVDKEELLGKLDESGQLYSLQNFATAVRAAERALPAGIIAEEFGFSDLALFYIDTESYLQREYYDKYEEYKESDRTKLRRSCRERNPNVDALLYFWGITDTLLTTEARAIVNMLNGYYSIPAGARR